jgi:Amino acid permease
LTIVILIFAIASNIAFNASTSRQTFAFARDNGLPFPKWVAHVHPTMKVPANALALICGITMLLSLLNIGSTAAFDAIISLQIVALMTSYSSVSCVFLPPSHPHLAPRTMVVGGIWHPRQCLWNRIRTICILLVLLTEQDARAAGNVRLSFP